MKRFTVFFALLAVAISGFAFYSALTGAQNQQAIMVAKADVPAYTLIQKGQMVEKGVSKSSITKNDLTAKEYQELFVKPNKPLVTTARFLADQRIDKRQVVQSGQGSFAMVAPDERVVAVSTTISGAAIGTINSGDVVDVGSSGSSSVAGGGSADFAKVLCIASTVAGCRGVLPAGVKLSIETARAEQAETRRAQVSLCCSQSHLTRLHQSQDRPSLFRSTHHVESMKPVLL